MERKNKGYGVAKAAFTCTHTHTRRSLKCDEEGEKKCPPTFPSLPCEKTWNGWKCLVELISPFRDALTFNLFFFGRQFGSLLGGKLFSLLFLRIFMPSTLGSLSWTSESEKEKVAVEGGWGLSRVSFREKKRKLRRVFAHKNAFDVC